MGTRRILPDHVKKFLVEFLKAHPQATYSDYRAAAKEANQVDFVVDSTFGRWRGDKTGHGNRRGKGHGVGQKSVAVAATPSDGPKREYRRSGSLYFKAWQTDKVDKFPVDLIRDMLESIMRSSKDRFEIVELSNPRIIEVRGMVK